MASSFAFRGKRERRRELQFVSIFVTVVETLYTECIQNFSLDVKIAASIAYSWKSGPLGTKKAILR